MWDNKLRSRMIGTVHDSIEGDSHPEEIFKNFEILKYESEEAPKNNLKFLNDVPLVFDLEFGASWGGAIDLEINKETGIWECKGFEKDIEDTLKLLRMNYSVSDTDYVKSKQDSDVIIKTIEPGLKYGFNLKLE